MLRHIAVVLTLAAPLPAAADDFVPVTEKNRFLDLIKDRELRIGL